MSINREMDKEDVATKRNEIVPFAEMWMDLEIAIQSEISKKEKNKYSIISLICGI